MGRIVLVWGDFEGAAIMQPLLGGWYTPDYAHLAERIRQDAERLDLHHTFVPVEKPHGSWEKITRMKAIMARHLLRAAYGAPLILVDVDARIRGYRQDVINLANIETDIALRMSGKISKSHGTTKMHPSSGTMVFRPTERVWLLLEKWELEGEKAPALATDEATLGAAICSVPRLTISLLPLEACAGPGMAGTIIEHPHRTGKRSRFRMVRLAANRITKAVFTKQKIPQFNLR